MLYDVTKVARFAQGIAGLAKLNERLKAAKR
jgi:hypothetical protein